MSEKMHTATLPQICSIFAKMLGKENQGIAIMSENIWKSMGIPRLPNWLQILDFCQKKNRENQIILLLEPPCSSIGCFVSVIFTPSKSFRLKQTHTRVEQLHCSAVHWGLYSCHTWPWISIFGHLWPSGHWTICKNMGKWVIPEKNYN